RQASQPGPAWGWPVFVLPFVEQPSLLAHLDPDHPVVGNGANIATPTPQTQTPLPVFRCPSDPGPPINPNYDNHATDSYRGVGWSRPQTALSPVGLMITNLTAPNGVLYRNSQ